MEEDEIECRGSLGKFLHVERLHFSGHRLSILHSNICWHETLKEKRSAFRHSFFDLVCMVQIPRLSLIMVLLCRPQTTILTKSRYNVAKRAYHIMFECRSQFLVGYGTETSFFRHFFWTVRF